MAEGLEAKMWELVEGLRSKPPLIICVTNYVSMDVMANGLLAAGASPAMVHAPAELPDAVPVAKATSGAVSVNIGTLDEAWIASFKAAVEACKATGTPWVLDPVAVGFTPLRGKVAKELLEICPPAAIRGNASEIMSLAGLTDSGGRGVDSTCESESAVEAAKALAKKCGCVVCVSGAVDYVADPTGEVLACPHGDALLTKITAMGCLVSSIVAAFIGIRQTGCSAAEAAAAGITFFNVCAEEAARVSAGPGTLRMHLMDQLHAASREAWQERKLEIRTSRLGSQ